MEAKELRIGNLVTWKDQENINDGILTITGLYLNDSVWVEWLWADGTNDGTDCEFDSIKPIPLSEEWLLKFGFEKDDQDCYSKWYDNLLYSFDLENGFCFGQAMDFSHEIKVEYVHQAQNIIFALTGEELTLNQ